MMFIRQLNMTSMLLAVALAAIARAESVGVRDSASWVRVEPGTFTMGARPGADVLKSARPVRAVNDQGKEVRMDRYQGPHWDEQPVHDVTFTGAFDISARRVTLGEFLLFKPEHAEVYAAYSLPADPEAPVTLVTWDEAQAYCRWVGEAEGSICRLPTEAEWEIAAGGLEGVGDGVQEWCYDWWSLYPEEPRTDPLGPKDGMIRVIRGRVDELGKFRVTDRSGGLPDERLSYVSFRVARVSGAAGRYQASPPPGRVFENVVQAPKSWERPDPGTPVFQGGFTYMDRSQPDASRLPFWGRYHVPSITWCDNGDLLATVITCPNDSSDQMAILITRLRDGTDDWDPPSRFFILPDRDVDAAILHRDEDGVLYHFNSMDKRAPFTEAAARSISRDNGATWSRPEVVRFHRSGETDAGFRAVPFLLHLDLILPGDGSWLMTRDVNLGFRPLGSVLYRSFDKGMSWHEMTRLGWQPSSFGKKGEQAGWIAGWHAAVAALRDGTFMAIGRTADIEGCAPLSRSVDQGRTWTYQPSGLSPISNSQRPVIKRLDEGPLMLVYYTDSSDITKDKEQQGGGLEIFDAERNPRRVYGTFTALSFDEGETWTHRKLLPVSAEKPFESDSVGYYSATQTPDGMIHLISTHRYCRFNLAWLKEPMPAP